MTSYSGLYGGNWAYSWDWRPSDGDDMKNFGYYNNRLNRRKSLSCENFNESLYSAKELNMNFLQESKGFSTLKQIQNSGQESTNNLYGSDVSLTKPTYQNDDTNLNLSYNDLTLKKKSNLLRDDSHLQYWSPQLVRSPRTRSNTPSENDRSLSPDSPRFNVSVKRPTASPDNLCDGNVRDEDRLQNGNTTTSKQNIQRSPLNHKDCRQNGNHHNGTSEIEAANGIRKPPLESSKTFHGKNEGLGKNNVVRFRFDSVETPSVNGGRFRTKSSTSSLSETERPVIGIMRKTSAKGCQTINTITKSDQTSIIGSENSYEDEDDVFSDQHDIKMASDMTYSSYLDDENGILNKQVRQINKGMDLKRQKQARKLISDYNQRQLLERWMEDKLKAQGEPMTPPRRNNNQRSSRTYTGTADEYIEKVAPKSNGLITPPPIPPRRYRADYEENQSSLKRSRDLTSEGDLQMVSPRSPSRRKRDAMLRKYNSTSALFSSTDMKSLDRHSLANSGDRTLNRHSYSSSSDDRDKNNNSESCSASSLSACDSMYDFGAEDRITNTDLNMVDIIGETFQARYPWQRDAYTQCDFVESPSSESVHSFPMEFNRSQSDDHMTRRQHTSSVRVRPQSIGGMDNIYTDDFRYMDNKNGRQDRLSEPMLSSNIFNRRRMPILVSDDPGSVSDLESIMENPSEGTVDSSRHNSIESAALTDEISSWLRSRISRETEVDVLASPRVSPEMWRNIPDVIVNIENQHRNDEPEDPLQSSYGKMQYLSVPKKPIRRRSSGSVTSGSEESDQEISPPVARRGRRAAIVDTKNVGDMSPTNLSPEVSPCNSCDEGESGSNIAGRLRRRRSSVELALNVYPGDLLVQEHHKKLIKRNTISDFYASRNGSTTNLHDDSKKQRQPFSLLKLMKSRSKESLTHLSDVLQKLKPSEFKDNHLAVYKNLHWSDLIASTDKQTSINETLNISEVERKRRESVWELFKSECVFLIDHLMVLKHCFLEPLKKVQVEGFVMYAEPSEIFSNLDELCYVSYTFCKDFIAGLVKDMSITDFGRTLVLIKAFQRFSAHSKDGSVYHTYCLNYTNALTYLEKLRKNDDFCEFEKWCEQDQRCNRLQLADLLIAPMQHCTKLPLLLYNIKKYTEDPLEKKQIAESIEKVETSLQQLEDKMKWLKNFERVQEIQRHLIWPSVTDLDSRAFVPEYLKPKLTRQPCERLLACPRRQLVHEGAISLTESTKSFDAFLFLFDDILLITKIKKPNRKKQGSSDSGQTNSSPSDNQTYVVHRQPIALDRLGIHDVSPQEAAANGLKYAFVIVQISRFQQIIDVFTLQAATELLKTTWLAQIREAKSSYCNINRNRADSMKENEEPSPPVGSFDARRRRSSGAKRIQHGKALSVDAIFL